MADLKNKLQAKATGTTTVKKVSPNKAMEQLMTQMAGQIKKALPEHMSSERFQRVALTAFGSNPKFLNCDPMSFLAAMMDSAQLGLEPNTPLGQAYIIPYGNKVQFQVGYKGLLELALRSGKIKTLYAHEVRANDKFEVKYGLHQDLIHEPALKGERGDVIGYYAVYHLDTGGHSFVFMTKEEVLTHARNKSKTFNNGPWQSDFDAMAKKTVIKQLLKYAPLSIEMQRAVSSDETVKSKIDEDMSLVNDESDSLEVDYEVKEDVQEGQGTFEEVK
ncbi:recombination protein RecT [Romboutsia sp. 1001216sp1]|uniref:recombination protein RecT n=1 Tax=Romboutsia sp. 1001216sp1 TaxID=2986997 RepID=UPI00232EEB06|nr:recombination protein RecT [Romboutsia sp. 1001216sp1]MDB8805044.1 recombination protein RecT [Romboutsia sp. 1001216sp1]MDB8808034.1 recombination protein RecT [Romboutsia sp. 1001216sp1]MDB8810689.1 recombination protein RecT [Romboutsia sp. 1001216sp1]MDB8816409.1 recombination protein RecT [Romboutsia sp. 1001216sp1]MDB8818638.1 recombination protein RecT [Romboutsia sp. 1001216sp1]